MENKHDKLWPEERKALKAIQLAFDVSNEAQKKIKREAIEQDRTPSDQVRSILGLPIKKPVRPRLTLSLNQADLALLAEKYDLNPDETLHIKEKAAQALIDWAATPQEDGDT